MTLKTLRSPFFFLAVLSLLSFSWQPQAWPGMKHKSKKMAPKSNSYWWPNQLDLSSLRDHDHRSNPYGDDFDYSKEFAKLDMAALKKI